MEDHGTNIRHEEAWRRMTSPADQRVRRFWIDPRFALGILLVVASVAGVSALLAVQNRSVHAYVARSTLVVGDTVRASDLELVSVRVPASSHYLNEGALPEHAVAVRSVPKGDLVPLSAVTGGSDARLTSIVVTASGPVAAAVTAGSSADIWSAHSAADKDYAPPVVLVSGAIVVSIAEDDSLVAGRSPVAVEVRVPAARVASVLQAMADGQSLSVVPSSIVGGAPSDITSVPTPAPTGSSGGVGATTSPDAEPNGSNG